MKADQQALPVGVFFFALGHDVDHPAGLVAACAAHALDVADGRRVRVKAHNQIYLQKIVLVWVCQECLCVLPAECCDVGVARVFMCSANGSAVMWVCQECLRVLPVQMLQQPPLTKLWGQFVNTRILAFGNPVWYRVDTGQRLPQQRLCNVPMKQLKANL